MSNADYAAIAVVNSTITHIEHFKPRQLYPGLALEYENLHASCDSSKSNNRHCGHLKGNIDPVGKIISPLEKNCASHFTYDRLGHIRAAAGDTLAESTIRLLGLDKPALVAGRRMAILTVENNIEDWRDVDQGDLPGFYNIVEYYLNLK